MEPFTNILNKSLIPVGDVAAISRIIDSFDSESEFVVPIGYKGSEVKDYIKVAHPDLKISYVEVDNFIGQGSGPGYSLLKCKELLQCPFVVISCDTLFEGAVEQPDRNWMGISSVADPFEFCTVSVQRGKVYDLIDKSNEGTNNAFIGLAGIKDFEIFFEALSANKELISGEVQLSNGLSALIDHGLYADNFVWFDLGNKKSYNASNKHFCVGETAYDFSKSDEVIYFYKNKVIKFFSDVSHTKNRHKRSLNLGNIVPTVEAIQGGFYSYEKVPGKTLYNVDLAENFPRLLDFLEEKLWTDVILTKDEKREFNLSCHSFYFTKTIKRVNLFEKRYCDTLNTKSSINGKDIPSVSRLLEETDFEFLSNGKPTKFHGDLQFDNIILSTSNDFFLIDWRHEFAGLKEYGDIYYDLGKLLGGILISYKEVKEGQVSFSEDDAGVELEHSKTDELVFCKSYFYKFLEQRGLDKRKVCLIFLNMSPMHHAPFDRFLYNLGRICLDKVNRGGLL